MSGKNGRIDTGFHERMAGFRARLSEAGIDLALVTDDDNIYYLTGYFDYLHMDFGRPTILAIGPNRESLLITPNMEAEMASADARVDRISLWNDGDGAEWRAELPKLIASAKRIGLEPDAMPPKVRGVVDSLISNTQPVDIADILSEMRMVKSPEELQMARHAGEVASAMMAAGRAAIGTGIAEFEVALATSEAGTRKAADLLATRYSGSQMSPNTHFLQIMASGAEITKPHHRASTKIMQRGEPVFLCFCGMTNFHRFKLGFDRTFWIGEIRNQRQAEVYEVALASQKAALDVLGPGIAAEEVHAAYAEVIKSAGFGYPFRCGRATGFSFLERPELVTGDKTILRPGMVFAVDGSVTDPGKFRAQVGDSFIITDEGYEKITHHPNSLDQMILPG